MKMPQFSDFREAVQHPRFFHEDDLRSGGPRKDQRGLPIVSSGGFALTFDYLAAGNRRIAIRCFHKPGHHLQQRYANISDFIRRNRQGMDFLIDVQYVPRGILVKGGIHPIVRMPWIEGSRLDYWIEDNLGNPHAIDDIRQQLASAVSRMRAAGVAHGDLQHGNILVDSANKIRLVDYDGMFLPSLVELGAAEAGHRNYQHPDRGDRYDATLDAFGAFVIDLSLDALGHDPSLWQDFYTEENLLFSAKDFVDPEQSQVFATLASRPHLAERVHRLIAACSTEFDAIPAILAGERVAALRGHHAQPGVAPRTAANRPVPAKDREAVRERIGDVITVVGQVVVIKQLRTTYRQPMTLINFGNYLRGDFTIVAFAGATQELCRKFGGDLKALDGAWISITGLVTEYDGGKYPASPQIELNRAQMLRVLDPAKAQAMLAPEPSPPQPPPALAVTAPAVPSAGTYRSSAPRSNTAGTTPYERRVEQLYSSGEFTWAPAQPLPPPQPIAPPPIQPITQQATVVPRVPGPGVPGRSAQPTPSRAGHRRPGLWQRLKENLRW